MRKGRHLRSDSRPPFSLGTEIAVRTTTNRCRLNRAQPGAVVVRKSLKRTAQRPRGHTSFSYLPFAVHQYGPDSEQKHFFSHTNSDSCDTFKRVATQAVARDRRGVVRKGPDFRLLLQSYKRPQPAPRPFADVAECLDKLQRMGSAPQRPVISFKTFGGGS